MFGKGISLGSLLGFPIQLDWSWFIIAILLSWSLATGFFPQIYPDLTISTLWAMGIAGTIGLFVSVVLHELGHAVIARRVGVEMRGITLFIFGGVAEMTREPPTAGAEFRIAIAGPIVSLLLCLAGYAVLPLFTGMEAPAPVVGVLSYLALINGILVAFNMIPAFPLDGGRVLRSAIWHWRKDLSTATRITAAMGSAFGIGFMILGVFAFITGSIIAGAWYFLIGLFLRAAARGSYQQMVVRRSLLNRPVGSVMNQDPVTVTPSLDLRSFVEDYLYRYHHRLFPVVDENQRLISCLRVRDVAAVKAENWDHTMVAHIAEACAPEDLTDVDTDAIDALTGMQRSGRSRLIVIDDDQHVLGIVTLKDLMAVIEIASEIDHRQRHPTVAW